MDGAQLQIFMVTDDVSYWLFLSGHHAMLICWLMGPSLVNWNISTTYGEIVMKLYRHSLCPEDDRVEFDLSVRLCHGDYILFGSQRNISTVIVCIDLLWYKYSCSPKEEPKDCNWFSLTFHQALSTIQTFNVVNDQIPAKLMRFNQPQLYLVFSSNQ